jgi:hypothetical protein
MRSAFLPVIIHTHSACNGAERILLPTAHFNSASEADSSVVFTLAFYTKDAAQIDRLFRTSGLMRPTWDQLHGD